MQITLRRLIVLDVKRTTRININRININPNDYYNPVIDYYNLVVDYYNPLLRLKPCLNQLRLILILCKININLINVNVHVHVNVSGL